MRADRTLRMSVVVFAVAVLAFMAVSPVYSSSGDCFDCWFEGCTYVSEPCLDCERYCAGCGPGCGTDLSFCGVDHRYCVNEDPEGEEVKQQSCACGEPSQH
jgi:hypothetical protein